MTRRSARPVVVAALIMFCVVAFGVRGSDSIALAAGEPATSEVIVQFSAGTSKVAMAAVASRTGVEVERSVAPAAGKAVSFAVYSSAALSVGQLLETFEGQPGVVAVSPNYVRSIELWPNDPRLNELWGLENIGQTGGTPDADIDASAAWDVSLGSGVVVADIDTGVDYTHPDLAANMWHNPGEIPGDGIDNDGNGYIDDVYGIDSYSGDSDPMDEHGHGTHTSGTMAAVGNNGVGVAGVAWQAKVMALRFLGPGGDGADDGAIACINYAIDMKVNHGVNVAVINASWGGGGYDPVLLNAIDAAATAGIVFCAAAGNSGLNNDSQPFYPASFSAANLIAVGSSTSADSRWPFSNYGATSVDLFAPGSSILSTYRRRRLRPDERDVDGHPACRGHGGAPGGAPSNRLRIDPDQQDSPECRPCFCLFGQLRDGRKTQRRFRGGRGNPRDHLVDSELRPGRRRHFRDHQRLGLRWTFRRECRDLRGDGRQPHTGSTRPLRSPRRLLLMLLGPSP